MENRKKQNLCLTLGGMIVILAGILVTILGYKLNRDGEITAKDTAVFVGYFLVMAGIRARPPHRVRGAVCRTFLHWLPVFPLRLDRRQRKNRVPPWKHLCCAGSTFSGRHDGGVSGCGRSYTRGFHIRVCNQRTKNLLPETVHRTYCRFHRPHNIPYKPRTEREKKHARRSDRLHLWDGFQYCCRPACRIFLQKIPVRLTAGHREHTSKTQFPDHRGQRSTIRCRRRPSLRCTAPGT